MSSLVASPDFIKRKHAKLVVFGRSQHLRAFLDADAGRSRIPRENVQWRRRSRAWAKFIRHLLDEVYSSDKKVGLVMDNLNTRSLGSLYETFGGTRVVGVAANSLHSLARQLAHPGGTGTEGNGPPMFQ